MPKSKRPAPKKSVESPEEHDDALARNLSKLSLELMEEDDGVSMTDALKKKKSDFHRIIRKCLQQKKDDVLDEALERVQDTDSEAYLLLKDSIEETSGVVMYRRDDGCDIEVNAFVIPLFAHTGGGLHIEQCFQDEEAFELLRKSFQEAQLESADANVVLVSHAYHLEEIDRITYSQLNEMVREALDSMTRKRAVATPAIGRSMSGWPENQFEPEDRTVELRFLLGFALKTVDDPFYRVPKSEAAADGYFETRAQRFQRWTQDVAPLVKRCLVTGGAGIEIDFLYQDLFHGGKERGIAEYYLLQMMAELHQDLHEHGALAENSRAVMGPTDIGGMMVLRVNLYAEAGGALVASSDKPIGVVRDLQNEFDDAYDALTTIGVKSLALAMRFDTDGQPVDVRPYEH